MQNAKGNKIISVKQFSATCHRFFVSPLLNLIHTDVLEYFSIIIIIFLLVLQKIKTTFVLVVHIKLFNTIGYYIFPFMPSNKPLTMKMVRTSTIKFN